MGKTSQALFWDETKWRKEDVILFPNERIKTPFFGK